ncbi:LPS export ABC transporter periplasmic protein LptC [Chitinilyticum aquatile]|uniref:LPS export ABC transporter periplasmic protein LptC n=1 Tax=Chitinilyticum aquatile TaxID=362520 RepID=UPI000408A7CC|nr:LPS export ABC transporter periplasmic protein LptC [Chitinilyticum aquatile]
MQDRIVTFLPLLLASVLGVLVYLLNQFSVVPFNQRHAAAQEADLVASSAMLVRLNEKGQAVSRLTASSVQHVPQDDVMLFESPVLLQTEPGKPRITVVGERARTIHRGDQAWFYGAVVLTRDATADGGAELLVRGSEIWLDRQKETAGSAQFITADQGPHHVEAVGFIADHRQQTLELLSKVKMTYVPTARTALGGSVPR